MPYDVTNVSATASGAQYSVQYSVTWTVPPDNGSPITSFDIYPEFDGDSSSSADVVAAGAIGSPTDPTPGAVDHAVLDLSNTTFAFGVSANNAVGLGDTPEVLSNLVSGPLVVSSTDANFESGRLGDIYGPIDIQVQNPGYQTDTVTGFTISGANPDDFIDTSDCGTLTDGASCTVQLSFAPGALGSRSATITPIDTRGGATQITAEGIGTEGYREVNAEGVVFDFGDAENEGDLTGSQLNAPIITMASTVDGYGYWLVGADGGIFSYGDAPFYGSTGGIKLNKPIVGMATTPDSGGYWMVASDGGIFSYGDAPFYGSTGGIKLNKPIVGMAVTPDGGGYWLVASDGGIFSYGDAQFFGSTGGVKLNKPIVGMAVTPDGGGYWLVASDGGIFSYGDAQFYGSTGGIALNRPIVGMAATPDGDGYWLMGSDGGVFNFGDAPFYGSAASETSAEVVGFAGTAPPTLQAIFDLPAYRHDIEGRDFMNRVTAADRAAPP